MKQFFNNVYPGNSNITLLMQKSVFYMCHLKESYLYLGYYMICDDI